MREYDVVRNQIAKALEISPPQFFSFAEIDLQRVLQYLELIFSNSYKIGGFSSNKEFLFDHLEVMRIYFEVLMSYPSFADLVKKNFPEKTEDFLNLLIYLHDFSRFIFSGPFPLTYGDWVSEGLLRKIVLRNMFPNNPEIVEKILRCLHSIDWIIGKKNLPENNNDLSDEQKLGLILKAIDTLGKREENGRLRDPDEFFSQNGGYFKWLRFQIEERRFPLKIGPNQFIDAEAYAERDIALTQRGIYLIEKLTGESFAAIRNKVQAKIQNF